MQGLFRVVPLRTEEARLVTTRKGNTMPKLRLLLGQWGRTVLCQVFEQDKHLWGSPDKYILYDTPTFCVRISGGPDLGLKLLYVRGTDKTRDLDAFSLKCLNQAEADELIAKIKEAVAAINAEPADDSVTTHTVPMEIVE